MDNIQAEQDGNALASCSSISSSAGTLSYSYVGNSSMLTQIDLPNGEKNTFTYDALERLTQIHNLTAVAP